MGHPGLGARGREPRPGFRQAPHPQPRPRVPAPHPRLSVPSARLPGAAPSPRLAEAHPSLGAPTTQRPRPASVRSRARHRPPPRRVTLCFASGPVSAGRRLPGSRARPPPRGRTRHRPRARRAPATGRASGSGEARNSGRTPKQAPRARTARAGSVARLCPHVPRHPCRLAVPALPAPRSNTPMHAPPSAPTSGAVVLWRARPRTEGPACRGSSYCTARRGRTPRPGHSATLAGPLCGAGHGLASL